MKKHTYKNTIFVPIVMLVFAAVFQSADLSRNGYRSNNSNLPGDTIWTAPKSADKNVNPLKKDLKAANDGRKVYTDYCVDCHGDKGKGDGDAAVELDPKPKDLSSSKVQKQSDGAIFWKISKGNDAMPSWESALTKKQIWQLVNYIRSLKAK